MSDETALTTETLYEPGALSGDNKGGAGAVWTEPKPVQMISWRRPGNHAQLRNLQGNILKGHGRKHVRLLFLRFNEEPGGGKEEARKLVRDLSKHVTSMLRQLHERDARKERSHPSPGFVQFGLTAEGFDWLGVQGPGDQTFKGGPGNVDFQSIPGLHAVLLLADGDTIEDDRPVQQMETSFRSLVGRRREADGVPIARVIRQESGTALSAGEGLEHFGYAEPSSSHPLLLREDREGAERTDGETDTYPRSMPTEHVLVDDAGSYLVYLKIEQHVRTFHAQLEASVEPALKDIVEASRNRRRLLAGHRDRLATFETEQAKFRNAALRAGRAATTDDERMKASTRLAEQQQLESVARDGLVMRRRDELEVVDKALEDAFDDAKVTRRRLRWDASAKLKAAGAEVVGRFENGTPLAVFEEPLPGPATNDFRYDSGTCPMSAHARQMNRRNAADDELRFPRRSIPYDDRPGEERDRYPTPGQGATYGDLMSFPDERVGLHFMAYNNDIERQFERLFRRIRPSEAPGVEEDKYPDDLLSEEAGFVSFLWGAYFFVPPISFLENVGLP